MTNFLLRFGEETITFHAKMSGTRIKGLSTSSIVEKRLGLISRHRIPGENLNTSRDQEEYMHCTARIYLLMVWTSLVLRTKRLLHTYRLLSIL